MPPARPELSETPRLGAQPRRPNERPRRSCLPVDTRTAGRWLHAAVPRREDRAAGEAAVGDQQRRDEVRAAPHLPRRGEGLPGVALVPWSVDPSRHVRPEERVAATGLAADAYRRG